MKIWYSLIFSVVLFVGSAQERRLVTVHKTLKLMGCRFDITVVSDNEELGYINADEAAGEIRRVEKMISSWVTDSETYLINQNAGVRPVKVSYEFFKLVERAKQISEITDGAFDISCSSIDPIWKFDGTMKNMPAPKEIKKAVSKVGYRKIELNSTDRTVFLKEKGMKISFGAIGKGYAADKAKELLVSKQVVAGVINASGDLTTWGTKASGEKWLIGVANPLRHDKIFSWMPILESSVATSSYLEKYIIFKGKKYSHIIDPRTGYPSTGLNKVSVFAKSAELCDALATAVFVLGKEAGLVLIEQLGGVEVIIIDEHNKIYKSKGVLFNKKF